MATANPTATDLDRAYRQLVRVAATLGVLGRAIGAAEGTTLDLRMAGDWVAVLAQARDVVEAAASVIEV